MGLISRLRRITRGRIEAFLDALEDPALIVPQLIDELADQVKVAANAEAKSLTAVKAHQRKLDEATGRALRMQRGAELALAAGKEDLARQAVALQLQAERDQQSLRDMLAGAQAAHAEARTVRRQLAAELESLRARRGELIRRAKAPSGPAPARIASDGRRLLDDVARMEEKAVDASDAADAADETAALIESDLASRQVDDLLRDNEVQRRLEDLRKQVGGPG
ncbi:MAG: PspA/IM30 family protein [Planctomycetes bacterium]|nr:PspA/IM30 family protein [Planctomycetota bacterium]